MGASFGLSTDFQALDAILMSFIFSSCHFPQGRPVILSYRPNQAKGAQMRRRHLITAAAAATFLLISAIACGSDDSTEEPSVTREATPKPTASKEATPAATPDESRLPQHIEFDAANFTNSTVIDNEWYPLQPGSKWVYEGTTTEGNLEIPHRLEFTVTDLTKEIQGVRTVVAWIEDFSDGELVEKEIAFYAQDNDGTVWYFGEHPEEIVDGTIVLAPTWMAGYIGAKPGVKMWADPQPGIPSYFQGWGPGVDWSDYAQVDQVGQETCVPTGCYQDVLVLAESSLDEINVYQLKHYARGIGEVLVGWRGPADAAEHLELVEHTQLEPDALAAIRAQALELEAHAYAVSPEVYGKTAPSE
jgi:hypothetical protein